MKRFYWLIILFATTSMVSTARKPEDTTYIPTTPLTDIQKYVDAYDMNEGKTISVLSRLLTNTTGK